MARPVPDDTFGLIAVGLFLIGVVAGLAGCLRSLDHRRAVAVGETRRAERPAIAADLDDVVAHHVTGILVQTQAARLTAADRPGDLAPVLAAIERAATEAPASMRRAAGVLRAGCTARHRTRSRCRRRSPAGRRSRGRRRTGRPP
ncbi:histidine kinase dimerization/phosphoacceptor domain-containing protein [Streptomyces roseochromogenus]|uniref:histidine kinase dimerization/phosphoacceptor domain-containing protein n=1 Tax=Streptomyces roseochromogenus TaxID=285450 RepID=UPI001428CDDD|nr:histidine kinase dimerization/phosphoacceptor domain-containing protein [Streptomyces roseochromogenus]